ncbi:MAG TPA: peptide chain release factor 3 [Solirubrobacteraceae bacterium]|nr:peptide chain release factor 3 [Solirubrobacteraceae bacterium]
MRSATPARAGAGSIADEAARRRTFAIISHPDAGKTTLTEKLLLYGGAVAEAGAVKARAGRREVTSDWMELERRRGISVTSTALRFEHDGHVLNLLDTPGHRDFSEDTLRVLVAADAAVMLLDAARGVEAQTLRLFQVARARRVPLLTFVNKYDRPGMEPLAMLDHLQEELGVTGVPLTWPVGRPGDFRGVLDARTGAFHRFRRTARGATVAVEEVLDRAAAGEGDAELVATAAEELALAQDVAGPLDDARLAAGDITPVLFGSALSTFGVEHLLGALHAHAAAPSPRLDDRGEPRPLEAPFSGLVFKVQANMDPRHRDRLAFLRVCSGTFERGMSAVNARTGRPMTLAHAHEVFGRERSVVDAAFPGDIVGIVNAAGVVVGDTLSSAGDVAFPPIPTLPPEHFVYAHNRQPSRSKQFRRGLVELDQEGVVHLLQIVGDQAPVPVLGAVGPLQLDVAVERLRTEFGADVRLEPAPWTLARRTDEAGAAALSGRQTRAALRRRDGTLLAAFANRTALEFFQREHPGARLDAVLAGG